MALTCNLIDKALPTGALALVVLAATSAMAQAPGPKAGADTPGVVVADAVKITATVEEY